MRLSLVRVAVLEAGCFSVLRDEADVPLLVTVEHTWEDNLPIVRDGVYICKQRRFNRGGYMTHEITGITGHTLILFHRGNAETDSEGCVLVGLKFGWLEDVPAVLESAAAFNKYWAVAGRAAEFELEVLGTGR